MSADGQGTAEDAAGVTAEDRIFFAFSFGPFLGFWTAFESAARLGCLCIPGGGQSSAARLRMVIQQQATVLCCTPTYALHLAEVAKEQGIDVKIGKFPFRANSRALTGDDLEGMVKFVADAKTDRVLGAHILHHTASELIAEAVSVIEFGGSSEDIGRTTHSHPTLSEAVREAALNVEKRALHIINR